MTQPDDRTNAPATGGLRAARKEMAAAKKTAAKKAPAKKSNVVPLKAAETAGTPAKAEAKAPAAKAAPKAPAKPKEPQDAEHPWYTRKSYTAVPGQKLYEAVGESGQIAVRSCAAAMTHAVSWGHTGQPGERAKAIREGVIANFYPSQELAEKAAAKFRADNPDDKITVVPAREYRGQE